MSSWIRRATCGLEQGIVGFIVMMEKNENFLNSNEPKFNLGSTNQLILDILQDKQGNIWLSSWNGGGVWKYDGHEFKNFVPSPQWYKANQDKRAFSSTPHSIKLSQGNTYTSTGEYIDDGIIFSMTEDRVVNFRFATRDLGFSYYDGKRFISIGRREGFEGSGATAILQDENDVFLDVNCRKGCLEGMMAQRLRTLRRAIDWLTMRS